MASTEEYIEFVCNQNVRFKKMFGEYMVYINDKPILLVCDNTVYVKKLDDLHGASVGMPYNGAKEHYILDIDDVDLTSNVVKILEAVIPVPKPRKKKIN